MNNTACQLHIEGEMTIYTAAETKARLLPLLAQCIDLEIDLSQVNEMDSAGLQLLILAKRACTKRNVNLHLAGHSKAVAEVLELCNMLSFFAEAHVTSSKTH
jgi:anti-sigma B factor antagonist